MEKTSLRAISIVAIVVVIVGVAAVYFVTQPEGPITGEKIKVAIMLDAPLVDPFSVMALEGMDYIRDELGSEIAMSESVTAADAERIAREYAADGYDLIIAHGFTFQPAIFATAQDYPEIYFAVNDIYNVTHNIASYTVLEHEAAYLSGMLAAGMSKTGIIGTQGGIPVPNVNRKLNGYILGAQAVNPDIQVFVAFLGSFVDTSKSKEAAYAQIDAGADVIMHASSLAGTGAIEAGEETGIYIIGNAADQNSLAPDTVITSILMRYVTPISRMADDLVEGRFEGKFYNYSMVHGAADIAPYHGLADDIPEDLKDMINEAREDIIAGRLLVPNNEGYPEAVL